MLMSLQRFNGELRVDIGHVNQMLDLIFLVTVDSGQKFLFHRSCKFLLYLVQSVHFPMLVSIRINFISELLLSGNVMRGRTMF